jgi:dihydrodipicolinate synthase/N-acetylneuraminate lyase
MTVVAQVATQQRRTLIERLFPGGFPALWCPPLTHYDAAGRLDRRRIARHLHSIAPYVRGLLVPGSTGDAWEMDPSEQRELLDEVLEITKELKFHVLVGVLRADAEAARQGIIETLDWLKYRDAHKVARGAPAAADVCGFTVCAPTGRDLSQQEIHDRLAAILELGVPTAIYQLPQVTRNEIAPQTVADLARCYANFYLLKDTSGADRVAASGVDLGGVCLLRGAEGDYHRWLRAGGGPYDGFLLSTANCFAAQLHRMIEHIQHGRLSAAQAEIAPVEKVVAGVFALVTGLPQGNPFTNANKAVDHFLAYGPRAAQTPPPRLHAGSTLPAEVIAATGQLLTECGLMPNAGYLSD